MSSTPSPHSLILIHPPPLHPTWVSHIPSLPPPSSSTDPLIRKSTYCQNCLAQNSLLLRTSLSHLTQNLLITSSSIYSPAGHEIPTRLYTPSLSPFPNTSSSAASSSPSSQPLLIYFHGGGLFVGDLDSEDLTCRQLSLSLSLPLLSVSYRLLPTFTADDSVSDALTSFSSLLNTYPSRQFILVGSSSGGQLAATSALNALKDGSGERILGVVLRCPVTCDATDNGERVPEEWKNVHTSMKEEFHTGILNKPAVTGENRVKDYKMPLEMLAEMPRLAKVSEPLEVSIPLDPSPSNKKTKWFIQLCTNDIYYSDGVCLGLGLKERGYDVKVRVEVGWPHTFWLKGMVLEEARRAEKELVKGVEWVLRGLNGGEEGGMSERKEDVDMKWVEWSEEFEV